MKKQISIFLLIIGVNYLHAQLTINDPNAEVRDAKNFHAISVSNAFDVYLSQGNDEAVAVSASEQKYRDNIGVEVKDGVLKIWFKNEKFWNEWKGDKMKLKAYVSFKNIDRLTASGACDVHVQGTINTDDLSVHLTGASDIKEAKINAKKLDIDVTGASDVTISGTATDLHIGATGASDIKGFDLAVDYCEVHASGASSISITVNKELSAHATGASDIKYRGDGLIREIKTSGASNVSKRS